MQHLPLNNNSEIQLLCDMYINQIKNEKAEIAKKESNIRSMNEKVLHLKRMLTNMPLAVGSSLYSDKWTWSRKIEFILENSEKPMTTIEIVEAITEYEPTIERKRAISSVSGTLSTRSGTADDTDKDFIRSQNERDEFAYQLKSKVFNNNTVLQEVELLSDLPF